MPVLPNRPSPVGTNTPVCPSIIRRTVGKASGRGMPCPKFATVHLASKYTRPNLGNGLPSLSDFPRSTILPGQAFWVKLDSKVSAGASRGPISPSSLGTAFTGHNAFKISSLSLAATYPTRHAGNRTTHRILESEHPVPSYFPAQNTRSARGGDCHQFRAFKESTTYGRIRRRNWLTVPSHHAVSPFCAGK